MRNLLIKEINAEIDHLMNTSYRETFMPDVKRIKDLYNNYTVEGTKDLSLLELRYATGKTIYRSSEDELYYHMQTTLGNKKDVSTKQLLELLPIFKALLNSSDASRSLNTLRVYMDIHFAKDFHKYTNKDKNGQRLFSIIDGLDHILGTKDSFFDIGSASLFLGYVNNKYASLLDPEYKDKLVEYYAKLYPFLDFYTSKETLTSFNNGEFDELSNKELSHENVNLIKYFLDCDVPKYRNLYYTYKYLDDLVKLENTDNTSLMVRFSYSDLSLNDFSEMPNIDISLSDLQAFINSYELSGNRFSSKQLEKLFANYRKNYLHNKGLLTTYYKEVETIEKAYNEFASKHFAHTTDDFILYFNQNYNQEFKCFSLDGKTTPLTESIFDTVIKKKMPVIEGIDSISLSEYMENETEFDDEGVMKAAKEAVYAKYYDILQNYLDKKDVTLEYFIRENVSPKDQPLFRELVAWYCKSNNCTTEVSEAVKSSTANLLVTEALKEQEISPLDERNRIYEKYKGYICNDCLEEHFSYVKLGRLMAEAAKKRLMAMELAILEDIKVAIANNTRILDVAEKYEVLPKDVESITTKHFKDKAVKAKLAAEIRDNFNNTRDEAIARKKERTKERWNNIVNELLESNERIEDFCRRYNRENTEEAISPQRILAILRHSGYFDEDYARYCIDRIVGEKIGHQVIKNKESIMFDIYNGIESCDGVRDCTIFDLYMKEGPIRLDDVKFELLTRNPYLDPDRPMKARIFVNEAINKYGLFFPDNTQERTYRIEDVVNTDITYVIGNEPHVVTEEEKETTMRFIEESGFPKQLYLEALSAYVRGDYDLKEALKTPNQYVKVSASNNTGGNNE